MWFRDLDALVDAHQTVTTHVYLDGERVHANQSMGNDRPWRVYSITKSIMSLLVGIAEAEGMLTLDDPVVKYLPQWRGGPSEDVTIRHILTMTSGREWSPALDDEMISIAADQSEFAIGVGQQHEPGTVWAYDNMAAQLLSPILTTALGDVPAFAEHKLVQPLGLGELQWERDSSGNLVTFAGITTTAADLGKIGQLVIDQGQCEGRDIVPADFIAAATRGATDLNSAYGYLWWTNSSGNYHDGGRAVGFDHDDEVRNGRLAPSVPEDAVWGLGWGSQFLAIVPSLKLVAIRLGRRPRYPEDLTLESFTATAVACLD